MTIDLPRWAPVLTACIAFVGFAYRIALRRAERRRAVADRIERESDRFDRTFPV